MADKFKVFTGARARFEINNTPIGFATNVSGTEEIVYQAVRVLDDIQVKEHVPTEYNVSMSASRVFLLDEPLKALGFMPSTDANSGQHLTNILNQDNLTCTIEDSQTGDVFAIMEDVKVAGHNWTVAAGAIVGEDINFVGIRMRDKTDAAV
jgi:hypothetical protein